jgi:membrane fusion protein
MEVAKAQLVRSIAEVEADLDTQSNTHDWSITAPCDGTIASLAASSGQSVDSTTLLISLVPTANTLQATLYASSREVGFLKAGQYVKIKLDAFPYQKFGLVPGQVNMVAQSPVSQNEISSSTRLLSNTEKAQQTYTVSVTLENQTINAYGRTERLQPGMQLSADVELDVRPLFEWILEPLFSLRRE